MDEILINQEQTAPVNTTPIWVHRAMIVPDSIVVTVRALADSFGPAAQNMWTTPLSPTGELPATHWISSGLVDKPFADFMPFGEWVATTDVDVNGMPIENWTVTPANPDNFFTLLQEYLPETPEGEDPPAIPTVEQLTYIMSMVDVSAQDPYTAMDRLGLKLVVQNETETLENPDSI